MLFKQLLMEEDLTEYDKIQIVEANGTEKSSMIIPKKDNNEIDIFKLRRFYMPKLECAVSRYFAVDNDDNTVTLRVLLMGCRSNDTKGYLKK